MGSACRLTRVECLRPLVREFSPERLVALRGRIRPGVFGDGAWDDLPLLGKIIEKLRPAFRELDVPTNLAVEVEFPHDATVKAGHLRGFAEACLFGFVFRLP